MGARYLRDEVMGFCFRFAQLGMGPDLAGMALTTLAALCGAVARLAATR
jgi:hypothetical protein